MNFKVFLEAEQHESDVKKMIRKLPKEHQKLLKGYKFKFIPDGTLKNDSSHVGIIDEDKKIITIAAPWNYGREFTTLHEIAHLVWKYSMDKKDDWKDIMSKIEHKQGAEETFCMYYAANYSNHAPTTYSNKTALRFIKGIK